MKIDEFIAVLANFKECQNNKDFDQCYKQFKMQYGKVILKRELHSIIFEGADPLQFKCKNSHCNNLRRPGGTYCCHKCCEIDLKERGVVHESWKTTRQIRCKNMKKHNLSRDKEFYNKRKEKYIKTCLQKYGVESNSQLEKNRQASHLRAINWWRNKTEEEKQDFADKMRKINTGRSSTNGFKTWSKEKQKRMLDKQHETFKRNHSFKTSAEEDKIYEVLLTKFGTVKRQYKSKEYPFRCDFYIPELDLYIEYQGYWTHGNINHQVLGPYDESNPVHQAILTKWKEKPSIAKKYKIAIKVWTISDPLKRKTAKDNHLNWIEFFTIEEFMKWFDKQ